MQIISVEFQGYRCFAREWTPLTEIKSISVVIGHNNSGKSQLIDFIATLCNPRPYHKGVSYRCRGVLDEGSLKQQFRDGFSGGELVGNHWLDHGMKLVGKQISWEIDGSGLVTNVGGDNLGSPYGARSTEVRLDLLKEIAKAATHSLTGKHFRRLSADRDIRTEPASTELKLEPDGTGATNIVRRYILSSSPQLPRELIQGKLLDALTNIFGKDGNFAEIQIKIHDEKEAEHPEGYWEIYLGEPTKGLISLSRSGSGLKTIILVLLNLLVIPEIEKNAKRTYVFAFEELENNLHPALLRRLFQYLEKFAEEEKATIFLTTHSNVALDIYGVSKCSQILHVTHDGSSAKGRAVSTHFDQLGVISELGAKPSDLLQANGVIWVEGPSDCIYLNRWIDLFSGQSLKEGRDYQCAYYGGSLLARTQFCPPEEAVENLANLFRLNSNIIVVCDGDRSSPSSQVKGRVRRIVREVKAIPGSEIWVTKAKEIENYLPGAVIAAALGISKLADPGQYELFFPRRGKGAAAVSSYVEAKVRRKGIDKMELAIQAVPHMTKKLMSTRFDLADRMSVIIEAINRWNT